MKYINNIFLVCLTLVSVYSFAQTKDRTSDKNFDRYWYKKAAQQYESAVKKGDTSKETLMRLGDSYFFNSDMENAAKWYGELFSKYENDLEPIYAFRYIQSLEGTGNYVLAKGIMKIYTEKLNDTTFNVDQLKDNDKLIDALRNLQPSFYVTHLSSNSKFSDFGAAYYGNRVVFASTRDSSVFTTRKYHWNNQPYLNLFIADTTSGGTNLTNVKSFSKSINSKYHEASAVFTKGFDTIYFTRNNYLKDGLKRDAQGSNNLKIYRAVAHNNNWKNIEELPFCSDDYSVGHPSLSPDGKKLYFTSDMPGTLGGSDIYVVDIYADGTFSNPKNLGNKINTAGREMFPFVTENKIYFASDGHLGYGGLDVFEATISENTFSKPSNLGRPLNSMADDFAYIVNETTQQGYVSSNRVGGAGDDDIYSFQRDKKCVQSIQGAVVNIVNGTPEANANVKLYTGQKVLDSMTTAEDGSYAFQTPISCETSYRVEASKEGYEGQEKMFVTPNKNDFVNEITFQIKHNLIVEEDGLLKIKIGLIYFDFDKWDITNKASVELDKVVTIMKEYPAMIIKIESHTDSRGRDEYNMELSDKRAKATRDYIVSQGIESQRIESAIGYGESRLLNECSNGVKCTEEQHDINRRSEFIILKMK